MSQPKAEYQANMSRDKLLEEIGEIFTPEQLDMLILRCKIIKEMSYGDVIIRFVKGNPRFLMTLSEDFPPPE